MLPRLRFAATLVAVLAMSMRALVPTGWMPNTVAGQHSALMPCPGADDMQGMAMPMPVQGMSMAMQDMDMPMPMPHPAQHDHGTPHDPTVCPFAATAHFTPPQAPTSILPPQRIDARAAFDFASALWSRAKRSWDHAARAPPQAA